MNTDLFSNMFKSLFGEQITPTSDQFVPITGSDGAPAGISSMANLMSLLGTFAKSQTSDFNTMTDWGTYSINDVQNLSNAPTGSTGSGYMQVGGWKFGENSRSIQTLYLQDNVIWFRSCIPGTSSWQTWKQLAFVS